MARKEEYTRRTILRYIVLLIFGVIACRVAYIQLFDSSYKTLAAGNVLRYEVQYAPRGEVLDRNGEFLVQSMECYDLMVIYRDLPKEGFDTTLLCSLIDLREERMVQKLKDARMSPRAPVFFSIVSFAIARSAPSSNSSSTPS